MLDDIRGDVAANAAAAAAAQAAVDEVADEVAAGRQRAALLQWSDWQGTIAYGNNPWGVAFDGSHIWVANYAGDSVSKIDAVTGGVVATIAVGNSPIGVAFDGSHIWVANYGGASVSKIPAG